MIHVLQTFDKGSVPRGESIKKQKKEILPMKKMRHKRKTLEQHLHRLAGEDPNSRSLESVYDLQKRKLNRYMSSVITTFPTYSSHDAGHSMNIICAMERILGKDRIKALSGVDTFLLLMSAYMHDVGMLYTEEEVRALWRTEDFSAFREGCKSKTEALRRAAEIAENSVEKDSCFPLDVRESVTILLMEYFRPRHGSRIEQMTSKTDGGIADLLRVEDSFLPERLIKMINRVSVAHTWTFDKVLRELPMTDTFQGEEFHPRMAAFLLRMGDLCDLDNDRFNKVGIAAFGTMGDENLAHYFKHKSIETLYLSPEQITVIADVSRAMIQDECIRDWMRGDEQESRSLRIENIYHNTIKEHINWKNWMEQEIRDAKQHVNEIFPRNSMRQLPEVRYIIKCNGKETESSTKNLKFMFSSEKAFSLIESISIYQGEKFIFVRELLQNALDATKLQLWRELRSNYGPMAKELSPFDVHWMYPGIFERYRIQIQIDYNAANRTARFEMTDSGIGISMEELKTNILTTGNSWRNRESYQAELREMPGWLRPTGAFGIGLHTVFSVTDRLKIETKSDSELLANEITLCSGKKDGYVFCEKTTKQVSRGSRFYFSFKLTKEQEMRYLEESDEDIFLKDMQNELQQKVISQIDQWCSTPLVPVHVNGFVLTPALTDSSWANELTLSDHKNRLLYRFEEPKRYEFVFSDDYESISIWDRHEEVVLSLSLSSSGSGDGSVAFKGIKLKDSTIGVTDGSEYLKVNYVDVLKGDSDVWIDAARTRLNDDAGVELQEIVNEAAAFARKMYLRLMHEVWNDSEVTSLRSDIADCAKRFVKGEITEKEVWKRTCRLKSTYIRALDSWQARSLNCRVTTYLIALRIIDESIIEWASSVEYRSDMPLREIDWKPFRLADAFIKKWKADWRVSSEWFHQPFFDNQMRHIAEHYTAIMAVWIARMYYEGVSLASPDRQQMMEQTVRELFESVFPFLYHWKRTDYLYQNMSRIILSYRGREKDRCGRTDMADYLFVPEAAQVFREWRFKAGYSEVTSFRLFLASPYYKILMDVPGTHEMKDAMAKDVWREMAAHSMYSSRVMDFDIEETEEQENLFDLWQVSVNNPADTFTLDCLPFLSRLPVVKVDKTDGANKVTYALCDNNVRGIEVNAMTKQSAFQFFWKCVRSLEVRRIAHEYLTVEGLSEYPLLVFAGQKGRYSGWLQLSCVRYYIPVWDYAEHIKEYLDQYCMADTPEIRAENINRIADSERFYAVTDYIWRKRVQEEPDVTPEAVRAQYREFLQDLFNAWFDPMPKG